MRYILGFICLLNSLFSLGLQRIENGSIDLRNHNFQENPIVKLNGLWLYSDSCLQPTRCQSKVMINVGDERLDQHFGESYGFGTYYLDVFIHRDQPISLKVPDQFSAYEIYINGELLCSVGKPDTTELLTVPARKVTYLHLNENRSGDTLKLAMPIANFTHHKRGIGAPLEIGTQKAILNRKFRDDAYDMFLTGCLILGGLFFLGLYLHGTGKEGQTALYFSLFCLCYAYRIVGWGNYVLHDLINIPYSLAIRLEYSSFYLCGTFFALYLRNLFPNEAPRYLTGGFAILSLGWALLSFLPTVFFSRMNVYYLYILLVGLMIVFFILIKALINRRTGAHYSLYGVINVLIVFGVKTSNYLGLIEEQKTFSILGELLFFLFQALILSKHFAENWKNARNEAEASSKAKTDFLSVMSHEIKTPLNAVIGTSYHLIGSNPRQDQKEDLQRLRASSENLLALVNNVLDYNRIESGKLTLDLIKTNLKKFCQTQLSMHEPIARHKGINLLMHFSPQLPKYVEIDKVRLGQILNNLLGNAVKFTAKGNVTLNVSFLGIQKEQVDILFEVIDTGPGIPEQLQFKIFDAFQQANSSTTRTYGGAGLGLSISQKLAKLMGSSIKVTSKLGQGAKFTFALTTRIVISNTAPQTNDTVSSFKKGSILLVEDNAMNVLVAKRFLTKWNLEVSVAENGLEALDAINEHSFDIILMDLQMPEMDGFEVTDRIREMGMKTPIIALTAANMLEEEVKKHQINDILQKPYSPEDLFEKLKVYIN